MKVGFLHIPKCAGTALSSALYESFGLNRRHIAKLCDPSSSVKPQSVERGSQLFHDIQKSNFVSGHLTFNELLELDRTFIFTTLREPMERLFSLFSYGQTRASNPKIVARRPELASASELTFAKFIQLRKRPNGIARLLFFDVPGLNGLHGVPEARAREVVNDLAIVKAIDAALSRFNMILAGSNQHLAEHLGPLTPRGVIKIVRRNESNISLPMRLGCSREEFADILSSNTWLDVFICQRAAILFPDLVNGAVILKDAASVILSLEERYELVFS